MPIQLDACFKTSLRTTVIVIILRNEFFMIRHFLKCTLAAISVAFPALASAQATCPLVEGQILEDFVQSSQLLEALSNVPSEPDEYQTTADYRAIVKDALGALSAAKIFEVDEGDRTLISYNADERRIEISPNHFTTLTGGFEDYELRNFFDLTVDDLDKYFSSHFIVPLGFSRVEQDVYTATNAFNSPVTVIAYDLFSIAVHGGLYNPIDIRVVWPFAPDEFVKNTYGSVVPIITIPMSPDVARSEMPRLRAVIATTGLGEEVLGNTSHRAPTASVPVELDSTNFLFVTEILCGAFIDTSSKVIKVVPILDEQLPYPDIE